MSKENYIATIGLEVHAQLLTESKIFSGDPTTYGSAPNTNVNPITLGHPGTLPKLNKQALQLAIRMGLACHSEITRVNQFARKNYFYADLPKGYQITQDKTPICVGGYVAIRDKNNQEKKVRLTRIHLEEDSGKSIHDLDPYNSLIDLNRAGVGLIEIVSEPDIADELEAYNYLSEIRKMVRYLNICDGNMEEGSLRCDANVSVRKKGTDKLGQRTEIKNINSLRNVQKAISYEIERQVGLLEAGESIHMETRSFDAVKGTTFGMRSKEEAHDYRYFPEPDLQFEIVTDKEIDEVRSGMPSLPHERFRHYTDAFGLSEYDAAILTEQKSISDYFEKVALKTKNYKGAANWVMGPVKSYLNEHAVELDNFPVSADKVAEVISLIDSGEISHSMAVQKLFPLMIEQPDLSPRKIAETKDLMQHRDGDMVLEFARLVIKDNPTEVERYRSGEKK
jgi:aspartyl-tRNA(Asn)/glutamyl-tRNA(Gln) amidotransferase subunit B